MTKPKVTETDSEANLREMMLSTARVLDEAPSWIIFSHRNLDGDAVGSATALFEAGLTRGKHVRWLGVDPVPPNYLFLLHADEYVTQKKYKFNGEDDLYIFLDSANEARAIEGLKERSPKAVVLNIDHHEDNTEFGTFNCVDGAASSTSEILWRIMTAANWLITQAIAESLYTGLVTDTGWFSFSNTTSATHLMASDLLSRGVIPSKIDSCVRHNRSMEGMHLWGRGLSRVLRWGEPPRFAMTWLTKKDFADTNAIPSDTEMLPNHILLMQDVRFAVLLTEDEDTGQVKASFRSKEGTVSAASVARRLGGGGHPKAAGAQLAPPMADAVLVVKETVEKIYAEWATADR